MSIQNLMAAVPPYLVVRECLACHLGFSLGCQRWLYDPLVLRLLGNSALLFVMSSNLLWRSCPKCFFFRDVAFRGSKCFLWDLLWYLKLIRLSFLLLKFFMGVQMQWCQSPFEVFTSGLLKAMMFERLKKFLARLKDWDFLSFMHFLAFHFLVQKQIFQHVQRFIWLLTFMEHYFLMIRYMFFIFDQIHQFCL